MADTSTSSSPKSRRSSGGNPHEVRFVSYPKLLFIWPMILVGYVLFPFAAPPTPDAAAVAVYEQRLAAAATTPAAQPTTDAAERDAAATTAKPPNPYFSHKLETFGWIYIAVLTLVLLTLGVDIGRHAAVFWVVVIAAIWILGMWLQDVKNFTVFGDIYRWFSNLDVQYSRSFGLTMSIVLSVPYAIMLAYARLNDSWRITHNEFEHYSLGKMDDSLGRGAKTIRTSFPDVLELLLGFAGTLIVFNSTGTKELRRIPHVMFLPIIRKRLNKILERTAITSGEFDEEEEEDDA